jgi:NAD(P)-dependent dehydrogenase (short-subunit alcohol dehydrogenase family)
MTQKTILITGCSTGIGYVCAKGLKDRGYRVFATARKSEDVKRLHDEGLEALTLDYRDSDSVQACAAEVSKRTGGALYATTGPTASPVRLKTLPAQCWKNNSPPIFLAGTN